MFASLKKPGAAYAHVELEGRVAAADPHGLIAMLFDGAIMALGQAEAALQRRDVAAKAKGISRAVSILGEGLRASLDTDAGGSLAVQLDELYAYMMHRLLHANLKNDAAAVVEVKRLLGELRGAWMGIKDRAAVGAKKREPAAARP
jgi:flagellar protein FliS